MIGRTQWDDRALTANGYEHEFLNCPRIVTRTCTYVTNRSLFFLTSVIDSGVCFSLTLKATATFNSSVQVFADPNNQTTLRTSKKTVQREHAYLYYLRYRETALVRETKQQDENVKKKKKKSAMRAVLGHANNFPENYFQGQINILFVMTYHLMFNCDQTSKNPFIERTLKVIP